MATRSGHRLNRSGPGDGIGNVGATPSVAHANSPPRSVLASAATFVCWFCLGCGGRWRDRPRDGRHDATDAAHRPDNDRVSLLRYHQLGGAGVDSAHVFADNEGHQTARRRIAWHLVGAAVSLIVGLVCLSIAWAGATVQYQARVERQQLEMIAKPAPAPSPADSSFVVLYGWHGEVLP